LNDKRLYNTVASSAAAAAAAKTKTKRRIEQPNKRYLEGSIKSD
jgi:hypothetical protein